MLISSAACSSASRKSAIFCCVPLNFGLYSPILELSSLCPSMMVRFFSMQICSPFGFIYTSYMKRVTSANHFSRKPKPSVAETGDGSLSPAAVRHQEGIPGITKGDREPSLSPVRYSYLCFLKIAVKRAIRSTSPGICSSSSASASQRSISLMVRQASM